MAPSEGDESETDDGPGSELQPPDTAKSSVEHDVPERESDADGEVPAGRCGYVFELRTRYAEERPACCWLETYGDDDRCLWHLDADKSEIVTTPLRFDDEVTGQPVFRGASIPGEESLAGMALRKSDFSDADVSLGNFSGADLEQADLSGATLRGTDFTDTNLRGADLSGADVRDADFTDADARGASFRGANCENAAFTRTNLRNVDLRDTRLYEVSFSETWINEATKFDDCVVYERDPDIEIERDYQEVDRYDAAAWTYRTLQHLARANTLPKQTRDYYVREKDARRQSAWKSGDYRYAVKAEVSRWVMEYGSNPWRIVAFSALIVVVCALLYPLAPAGGIQETDGTTITYTVEQAAEQAAERARYGDPSYLLEAFLKSLYFSVVTFATLGYGDIQPFGTWARALATIETTLGSLLLALLVFVLSRSVTW